VTQFNDMMAQPNSQNESINTAKTRHWFSKHSTRSLNNGTMRGPNDIGRLTIFSIVRTSRLAGRLFNLIKASTTLKYEPV